MKYIGLLLVLVVTASVVTGDLSNSCPTASVAPCTCAESPFPYLVCDRVNVADDLVNVFINSQFTRFLLVRITNSALQYLPSDVFHNVEVKELQLYNVTLVQLFDETPEDTGKLETLHMELATIFKGIIWEHLQPMTELRILNIYNNHIEELGSDFVEYAPKSLQQLSFYDTQTSVIKSGVFNHFPLLDKLAIDKCGLNELRRDMFPVPFKARWLYFNDNKITTLPENIFSSMPNLRTISFRNNNIAHIPKDMFNAAFKDLEYLFLDGNPLTCDCSLSWLASAKKLTLKGKCAEPEKLKDKNLDEVDPKDFVCWG